MTSVVKFVLICGLCMLLTGAGWAQAPSSGDQEKSLGDAARELRGNQKTYNPCPPEKPCGDTWSMAHVPTGEFEENEDAYRYQILNLANQHDFAALDEAADTVRKSKERFAGGTWKLYDFYDVLAMPPYVGGAPERDWPGRFTVLQEWVAANPQSVTARIALAACFERYAWAARGRGYANTVTDAQWKLYHERALQAFKILQEADVLPTKCPHWYFEMENVAADLGSKTAMRSVFERALAAYPDYYHTFREYAFYLQPKWYGEPGEAEALADELDHHFGGKQGAFLYFEIGTVIYCACNDNPTVTPILAWRRLQQGFAVEEEQYGVSMMKLNRYAYLAYLYRDQEVARSVLARVGNNWNPVVWRNYETFDKARAWAGVAKP